MNTRVLASGRIAVLDSKGKVVEILTAEPYEKEWIPTCGLCDGVGHGYPGAGPCPVYEDHQYPDEPDWAL
jgi:hypothetical protein